MKNFDISAKLKVPKKHEKRVTTNYVKKFLLKNNFSEVRVTDSSKTYMSHARQANK